MLQGAMQLQQLLVEKLKQLDGIPILALRLYLIPVFWMAGSKKLADMEGTIAWFGNPDWGLGLPMPEVLAYLAAYTELFGAILLALGLFTRWISLALLFTMVVAATTVHLENGWSAIAEGDGIFATERSQQAHQRLDKAKTLLKQHGNYAWLTAKGPIVVLNNGIEFAATYAIMCLALLFFGGGRYVSLDYWLWRRWAQPQAIASLAV